MTDKPTKMTLELTHAERSTLDDLRRARGDRSAAATIRALIREDARRLPLRLRDGSAHPGLTVRVGPGATPEGIAAALESALAPRSSETGSPTIHDVDRPDAPALMPGIMSLEEAHKHGIPVAKKLPPACAQCGQKWQEGEAVSIDSEYRHVHAKCPGTPRAPDPTTRAAQLETIAACPLRAHHVRLNGRSCPGGCGA